VAAAAAFVCSSEAAVDDAKKDFHRDARRLSWRGASLHLECGGDSHRFRMQQRSCGVHAKRDLYALRGDYRRLTKAAAIAAALHIAVLVNAFYFGNG
jgi:hypothetical protein